MSAFLSPLGSALLLAALAAAPLAAQPAPPPLLADRGDLRHEGSVSGLDVWVSPSGEIFFAARDGAVLVGTLYSASGRDIGAAFADRPPSPFPGVAAPAPRDVAPASGAAVAAPSGPSPMGPTRNEILRSAGDALAMLDAGRRDALLLGLENRLEDVSDLDGYRKAVLAWRADVIGALEEAGLMTDAVASDAKAASMLESLRRDGFWFSIGDPTSPAVYAVIDPLCPFCSRSLVALRPALAAGELHLRVLLVAMVSRESLGAAAAVLADPSPAVALLDHAAAIAAGRPSPLSEMSIEALPPEIVGGLQRNVELVEALAIEAVPAFAWSDGAEARLLIGQAEATSFAGAAPDPDMGRVDMSSID